jgi:hypothetical protein
MSIAELIMQGTNRASESTAWVGDSLAKLGQQVGASLAQREQQKQAQEMLPMFQQSMQESMKKAGEGKSGEAYSILMPFLTDPSVARNPFMMPALEAGIKMNQIAADDFLRQSQINAYKTRYATTTNNVINPQTILDTMNGDGGVVEVDETINPEGVNPVVAGSLPGLRIPTEGIQTQRGMSMTPKSITAQATAAGLPATTPIGTPQTREEIDAAEAAKLPTDNPPAPLARGPLNPANPENALFPDLQAAPPPKNILEKFIKFEDKFAALPFEKQKAEMDNNSILFPNKEMLSSYKPTKGRGLIEISSEAGIGVPGLAGAIEIPEAYKQYIVGSINVDPSTGVKSYSLRPEVENDPKAKAALGWLQDWQNASIEVSSNPQLRDLLSQAGNDALAIDVLPLGKGELSGENMVELSVRGKPETKIEVPQVTADQIKVLRSQTGAANVHNAKFIRLKSEEPAAKAPAPTQGGTKKLSLEEIAGGGSASAAAKPQPEKLSADNPFAQAVSEKQTQASATTKQSIETQKTKIQDSISELENKLKILTAVGQRNPEILPDYLRRKMSAYMNATPSRNAKDFEDTKKEIEKLRVKLKSL